MEMRSVVAKLDSSETGKLVSVGILLNHFNKEGARVMLMLCLTIASRKSNIFKLCIKPRKR